MNLFQLSVAGIITACCFRKVQIWASCLLSGKEVFACETAIHAFKTILNTLAGPNEKQRAEKLLEEIKIVPDDMSERCKNLPLSAKLKHRSKIIFGTGDKLQSVTMTANSGFVRAAKHQGVLFSVFFHQARALTEMKESLPTTISQEPAK